MPLTPSLSQNGYTISAAVNAMVHLSFGCTLGDMYVPIDPETVQLLEGPAGPTGKKAEIDWLVKIHARDGLHEFPTDTPQEDRDGEPVYSNSVVCELSPTESLCIIMCFNTASFALYALLFLSSMPFLVLLGCF